MGGTRFGGARLASVRAGGRPCRFSAGVLVVRSLGCLAALLVAVLVLVPGSAWAEPVCTDTWTGPNEGTWQTAANWSKHEVPTSIDVACIEAGKTVELTEAVKDKTGVLLDNGSLVISSGSLEVANAMEASSVASLSLSRATITGAGEIDVTASFVGGGNGSLEGTGALVIKPGATGTIETNSDIFLNRPLVNNGSFTISGTSGLGGSEQARFTNNATLTVNGQGVRTGLYDVSSGAVPILNNSGIVQKTEGTGQSEVAFATENNGLVTSKTGDLIFENGGASGTEHTGAWTGNGGDIWLRSGTFSLGAVVSLTGSIRIQGSATAGQIEGSTANLEVTGKLTVNGPIASIVRSLEANGGTVTDVGEVDITESFADNNGIGKVAGGGGLVIEPSARGEVKENEIFDLAGRLVNKATFTIPVDSGMVGLEGAVFVNESTLTVNGQEWQPFGKQTGMPRASSEGVHPRLVNLGTVQKIEGNKTATIQYDTENYGYFEAKIGQFEIPYWVFQEQSIEYGGPENQSAPEGEKAICGEDVSCASGNLSKTQTDFAIGGRGVGLDLARTYNSQAAAAGEKGPFGYGWTSSFSDHLIVEKVTQKAILHQADGSTVTFIEGTGGAFTAPAWTQDVLSGTEMSGYTLTLEDQTVFKFAGATGRLESVTDRNGNATTLAYNEAGQLKTITDPGGRKLTLTYNAEGFVESVEDPLKHLVKYEYDASHNLIGVTQPGEAALRWRFPKYDGSHRLEELEDGRKGKYTFKYTANQVVEETDPMTRATSFEYKPFETRTTNKATGAVTVTGTTSTGLAAATIHGYGTTSATTEANIHDAAGNLLSTTDGNNHTTKYTYDTHGNRLTMVDPTNHETKWTYNSTHDVETETKPNGETTTYKRDSHGNPEVIERPAPESKTQVTKYKYDTHGNVESMEDPLKRVWKYEYDTAGDKTAEIDPESDKRTWGYNEDSQETSMVSPRGHVKAGEEAKYTTKTERDAQGRPIKVTDPLLHETKYKYDGDGNLEVETDPEGHETIYTYDADNEQTKVKEPNGTVTETGYDGAGEVTSQTDGNKNETKYVRNILEQVTEVVDPKERKTTKEYDGAGNLKALTDPAKRTTTYAYDAANRLTEVSYSSGKPETVKYEYNPDGKRTKMTDGTGTTTYGYDQLDRLTETENGHKETVKYGYDLANEQTKITYPNTKAVIREYDKAGRLEKVTDWSSNVTKFAYDADSDLKTTTYPTGTSNVDTYTYDETDAMKEVKMTKGAETLASLLYTRNKDGQVKGATSKGLPGEEKPAYEYDTNNRLTKGATISYKYDAANNPTTIGTGTYKYDKASELETGPSLTYTYDELGERTKTKPTSGPATTYGYDQASDLTTVERPKEGEKAEIKDTYAYNGDGLRTSQTINGTTTYMAWEEGIPLPLLLTDGTNNYIYGPGGLPTEQISTGGTILYLHHDQQGSTRLITSSTGTKEASFTYGAYGELTGHTGTATTPLGYDSQYTNTDTGLIYLRARYYDPATAQFLSVDPQIMETRAAYAYAADDPVNRSDATGLTPWSPKVKQAIAQCRSWKTGPSKNSRKNPFYHNKAFYQGCEDLLHLPPEVFGTGRQAESHTGLRITAGVAGASAVAFGVGTFVACEGATDAVGTAHCAGAVLPSVQIGVVALGYALFGE